MKITILGAGASSGVPQLGLGWGRCDRQEPRNRRRRFSILVQTAGRTLLIDTSPDCRAQLLDAGVSRLDGVLYTHEHADHCHGIDDLRWICLAMQADLPIYGAPETLAALQARFQYCFTPLAPGAGGYYYKAVLRPIPASSPFSIVGVPVIPFPQTHGRGTSTGYRIGDFACSTDVSDLSDAAFAVLEGVRLWAVDALQPEPHPTHADLQRTLGWIARVRPERAVLIHMNAQMDYQTVRGLVPPGVEPGYDGLTLQVP